MNNRYFKGYEVISLEPNMSQFGYTTMLNNFSNYIIKYLRVTETNNPLFESEEVEEEILVCTTCFSNDITITNSSKEYIIECNNCHNKEVLRK